MVLQNVRQDVARFLLVALGAVIIAALMSGCARMIPLHNVVDSKFPTIVSRKLSLDEIADAMSVAGAGRADTWVFFREKEQEMVAELNIRQHYAKVRIPFSKESFSIYYASSEKLLYNGDLIHRNYNKWVKLLEQDIIEACTAAAAKK